MSAVATLLLRMALRAGAAAMCALFGGGGHIRAAGAEIDKSMEETVKTVLATAKEAINAASAKA